MAEDFDRVRDDVLVKLERTGQAYTGEVKAMARELRELRAKLNSQTPTQIGYHPMNGWTL